MKTELHLVPTITLEKFAEQHDLTMVICERETPDNICMRYYAFFKDVEVHQDQYILSSTVGNGSTPSEAMSDYGVRISGKTLVTNYTKTSRREIKVPRIVH